MNEIIVKDVSFNNLKKVSINIKQGEFVCFIGESGSGKSTLAVDVIYAAYFRKIPGVRTFGSASLFEQNYVGDKQKTTVCQYLYGETYAADILQNTCTEILNLKSKILSRKDLEKIVFMLGLEKISLSSRMELLSASVYRKLRFLKLLISNVFDVLIVDELAAGMNYSEASAIGDIFCSLKLKGITVLAIEHSLPVIMKSDSIIELGPGAGAEGGNIVYAGSFEKYSSSNSWKSLLLQAKTNLSPVNMENKKYLTLSIAKFKGLSALEAYLPLMCIVNVFGKSSSGKTSFLEAVFSVLDKTPGAWSRRKELEVEVKGKERIRRAHVIEQSPIGSNPFSTPATYSGIMDILRKLYAQSTKGYTISDFSYLGEHKCKNCEGRGYISISAEDRELNLPCPSCSGTRYDSTISKIKFLGMNLGKLLTIPCNKVLEVYASAMPKSSLTQRMNFIKDVGLDYICLGQPSNSLSGGESQRLKITKELAKKLGDRSVFILDNPTLGLHVANCIAFLKTLRMLVQKNNSVIISDNNPLMIRNADYIILMENQHLVYQGVPQRLPKRYLNEFGL